MSVTGSNEVLDYDSQVEAYESSLEVSLRGFRPAAAVLDTWVPDEELVRSLTGLVEAAQIGGGDSVAVRVSLKTLNGHKAEEIQEGLSSFGEVSILSEDDSVVFTVAKLRRAAAFRSVRAIYQ